FYITMMKNMTNEYIKVIGLVRAFCALYLLFATGSGARLLGIFAGIAVYIIIVLPPVSRKIAIWLSAAGIALFAVLFASKNYSKFWELFLAPQTMHS
ncbi:hypothetical protein FO520_22115, partial [Bacillus subtilis]